MTGVSVGYVDVPNTVNERTNDALHATDVCSFVRSPCTVDTRRLVVDRNVVPVTTPSANTLRVCMFDHTTQTNNELPDDDRRANAPLAGGALLSISNAAAGEKIRSDPSSLFPAFFRLLWRLRRKRLFVFLCFVV
jgi:hypothetical protein